MDVGTTVIFSILFFSDDVVMLHEGSGLAARNNEKPISIVMGRDTDAIAIFGCVFLRVRSTNGEYCGSRMLYHQFWSTLYEFEKPLFENSKVLFTTKHFV